MSSTESGTSPEGAAPPVSASTAVPVPVPVPAPAPTYEPVLVQFGDAHMTEHWLVTPQGTMPLAGTQVFVADLSHEESVIPGWAIALAIIGALFFLIGLLFLIVREKRSSGFMQITLTNGAFTYQTAEVVRADRSSQLFELQNRANYARGMIARA